MFIWFTHTLQNLPNDTTKDDSPKVSENRRITVVNKTMEKKNRIYQDD